ncbi:MAG: hypothetical protein QM725_07425 [Lacibacter sp.]|nr:hypothetical protein [Ferruginibacter sp.]HMP20332.1 hypothetical protein [Ferruginibacter sp.]
MREELHSSIGLYSPSFLKMHIDVNEYLDDIFEISPLASAAYIHEYVHFLQDITTVYGQKNIISVVDYIKSVNFNQRNAEERILSIPYIPEEKRDPGAYYNGELQKIHIGTIRGDGINTISEINKEIVQAILIDKKIDVEIVKLVVTIGQPPKEHIYQFGSHAIIESMAFAIEQSIYPGIVEEPNDFCYRAASEIIHFCYPELMRDPLNVIALCDASLMYFNPAAIFYNTLLKMKDIGYIPTSAFDIYRFVHSHIEIEFWGLTQIDQIFNNHTLTALSQLNDYFTTDLFAPNRVWIDYTFRKANEIRSKDWGFFIKLASDGPIKNNPTFKKIFASIGIPLVTNRTGNAVFASPVEDETVVRPDILWAINQIYNIYINSAKSQIRRCGMEDWCRASCLNSNTEDYTDYRCIESPWERVKDKDNLCVFSQIWRTWGMENEIPTIKR